jgi:hypothetical protein
MDNRYCAAPKNQGTLTMGGMVAQCWEAWWLSGGRHDGSDREAWWLSDGRHGGSELGGMVAQW